MLCSQVAKPASARNEPIPCLAEILGRGGIATHSRQQPVDSLVVGANQLGSGFSVAAAQTIDELGLAQSLETSGRGRQRIVNKHVCPHIVELDAHLGKPETTFEKKVTGTGKISAISDPARLPIALPRNSGPRSGFHVRMSCSACVSGDCTLSSATLLLASGKG